jgi:lysylphosphatidylglycerol synthetase-like protein (DUF2156 family)
LYLRVANDIRAERKRIRWFFAGLLIVSATLNIVGALLIQHQTRSQVLDSLVPSSVTLGGRTGAVLAGLALLLLAGGVARGKRVAHRLTLLVLVATIGFDLLKDLDFEAATLSAWILFGLWWFRHHFDADSEPSGVRWGIAVLAGGVGLAVVYAVAGSLVLGNQLSPEPGAVGTLESLTEVLVGNPARYQALTVRASWFLGTLPVVSYGLVLFALLQLLRPVLAPLAAAADRERAHELLRAWGRNHISHLAVHGAASYHWFDVDGCVAFSQSGRTALALGEPIGPPGALKKGLQAFVSYCERQDWIPAFYQVEPDPAYRELEFLLVPIGSEALIPTQTFGLQGKERAHLRNATRRCEKLGVRFAFISGPDALAAHAEQLREVSDAWLRTRRGPELGYSLGTLSTLTDPDIIAGLAFTADGRLQAFVSWLPVPARSGWTLDLMRRRPDAIHGVMEALIVRSIEAALGQGIVEVSLGVAPSVISSGEPSGAGDRALRAMFWGLDRFQRSLTLHEFKAKFRPVWEERYLAVPGPAALPEVLIAVVRAHLPAVPRAVADFGHRKAGSVRAIPA